MLWMDALFGLSLVSGVVMYSDSEYDENFVPSPCPSHSSSSSSYVSSSLIQDAALILLYPPPPPPPGSWDAIVQNYLYVIRQTHVPRSVRRLLGQFLFGRLGGR